MLAISWAYALFGSVLVICVTLVVLAYIGIVYRSIGSVSKIRILEGQRGKYICPHCGGNLFSDDYPKERGEEK